MKYLAPIPKQFVDQNGLPLSDGKVHVYISGDTQYANVYQDADGNELMPNPARLDSNGAWFGFVTAGIPMDYVVEDKDGNVQFEYEKVVAGGGTANVAIEPVLTSGTKIAECWVDGELLELFAPDSSISATLPIKIVAGSITNNGTGLTCTGDNAWAEGNSTKSTGQQSHAEGYSTEASANYSHAEGCYSKALQGSSHAEGFSTKANGVAAHAEGYDSEANGNNSHAEGKDTVASGSCSHAGGTGTRATGNSSTAIGKYNDDGTALLVVGNGTADNARNDCFKVDSNGDTWVTISGVLTKVTNVSGGGGDGSQVVLVRSNMTTDFTNAEYQDCVDAVTAGKAVCVQFERNSRTFQAQLTQVENETGLLVFEIDVANIHITYEVSGTNNSHTITESDYQNGTPIFDTLQTAILWNVVLHNGDIFETNGFHASGDGGAARYKVTSSGTANGKDIIQLAAGKLAILQVDREAFVEQIGYEPKNNAAAASDLTPYIQRLFAMNVYRIKFKATYLYYYMKTPLEVNKHDAEFIGGLDTFSGYSSRIEYVPNNDVTEDYCFRLNARRIKFKHLYINDNPTRTHICFKTDNPSGNHEGYVFDGLNVSLFDIAFSLCGSVNWQHTFNRVRFNQCRIGLYTQNTFFMNNLTECYFSCLEKDVFSESEYNAVTFMNCNFECLNTCVHFSYWKQDPELARKLFTLTDAKFICCSFEFHLPEDVPSNVQGCFIYVDDFVQAKLNLDNQNLSLKKLADTNPAVTDTTCFSFGENTYCTFVSVRGQDYTSYWASKFLWDNTRHPAKDIGAITIVNSYNIPRPSFGDLYLPTFRGNDGVIFFSNSTNILVNYPSLRDGDKLFNLDDGCYYTKSSDQLVKVSNSPSNFVRIGDELYNYVVIGTKKWITRSLRLQTTNSKILFKKETGLKEEWGLYYPFGDRTELSAKLPSGWRIPTKTDLDDLISALPGGNGTEKAHNAQSTQYPSAFPDATNTSGLNIPPSQQYVGTSYVRGYFMSNTGKYTLVVNANGILEYDITPDYPNLISPIRVCADV